MAGRHNRPPALTLVTAPYADSARRAVGGLDWSGLMARAQDGDRQAYRALLEDLAPYLRSIAGRCFKQPSDVEDAVQDVLLTVHMVRHAYDPTRPFGPWLLAIANRRIIDRLRRQTRQKAREIALSAEHEVFSTPAVNTGFDEVALDDAIERLPPEQRQAIKMLKLSEMSLREAAAASGRSAASLKVATHRAIKSVRNMLRRQNEQS